MQVIDSWPHPSHRTRLARDQRLIHALLDECSHGKVALSDAGVADRLIGCWPDGSRFDLVMAIAHDVRVHERPPPTGTTPEDRPLTLFEEHGLLLRQVAIRAGEVLAVTADGDWPTRELQALLTYMRAEVLRQAVDEERLLFPSHASTSIVGGLARDHTTLHLMTEMLADAATEDRPHHPAQLAATTQELVSYLERHLNAEQAALVADGHNEVPGTTHLTAARTARTSGMPSPKAPPSTWTRCPRAGSSTRWRTGCCACAAANGSNCTPAGTRTRSGSAWTASVPVTTASFTSRMGQTSGWYGSVAASRRNDGWRTL